MNWEEKILTKLADSYRKSKKGMGTAVISRKTSVKPSQLYKKYHLNDGNFSVIDEINEAVKQLTHMGFIQYNTEKFSTNITRIDLVDEKISEIESYLSKNYHYVSENQKRLEVMAVIEKYNNASYICTAECQRLQKELDNNKIPANYSDLSDIFKMLAFVENNKYELYIREASIKVYGDTKFFEEKTMDTVCKILRQHLNRPCEEFEMLSEILSNYHIYKEAQKICIKGSVELCFKGGTVNVSLFPDGLEFDTKTIESLKRIIIHSSKFMTIENRTSYLRYERADTVTMYLGGFANRFQRDFINKIYMDNPDIQYLHFGDIDAGGFLIHNDLCKKTGIHFLLFCMSFAELEKYKDYCKPLSENDEARLTKIRHNPDYEKTIAYCLEHHTKLEQEIISFSLMQSAE